MVTLYALDNNCVDWPQSLSFFTLSQMIITLGQCYDSVFQMRNYDVKIHSIFYSLSAAIRILEQAVLNGMYVSPSKASWHNSQTERQMMKWLLCAYTGDAVRKSNHENKVTKLPCEPRYIVYVYYWTKQLTLYLFFCNIMVNEHYASVWC